MKRLLLVFPLAVLAVLVLFWSQQRRAPLFVSGIIEADEIRVGSRVGGRVRDVKVQEGQRIAAGGALVELQPFDLNERLAQAIATQAARRAELERLQAGFRPEEVEQARARRDRLKAALDKFMAGPRPLEISILSDKVDVAKADRTDAQNNFDRIKRLFEQSQANQQEADEATWRLAAADARLRAAENELALAREGTRAEEIAEARAMLAETEQALAMMSVGYRREDIAQAAANVDAAAAAVAMAQRQIDELTITAPDESTVEAIDLQPGDLVAANAPVITLLDPRRLWVRAYVPERLLALNVGDTVSVRVDPFPERRFKGRIAFISRQAEFTPANAQTPEERGKQVFRIRVLMDEGLDVLRAGMSADVFLEPGK